jgi:hypothetical protein
MGKMFFGEHPVLEEEANRLIRESMKGKTSHESKSDILTPWKLQDRRRREVYVQRGVPEAALRSGNFGRVASHTHPHLNAMGSLSGFVFARRRHTSPGPERGIASSSLYDHVFGEDN